jgi:hypothetical protein
MSIFGYSKRVVSDHGPHEMSEVTFDVSISDMRRIARFLNDCADKVETGEWRSSHCHLTEFDSEWNGDHPDSDVIVINPVPEPPKTLGQ